MGLLTSLRSSISRATSSLFEGDETKRIGIYGPPNAGKCLAPDEEILLADGTYRRIEDMFESVAAADPTDVSDDPDETWLECESGTEIRIPALRSDLSVTAAPVSHVFRQQYDGPLYRIETRLGREVTVSPAHPFVSATENGIENVPAETLEEGDRLALLSSFTPTPETSGEWTTTVPETLATDGGTAVYKSTYHRPKPVHEQPFDARMARFLALTIAEAQHEDGHIAFANESERLREEFRRGVERFGVETTTYEYDGKTPVVRVNSQSLTEYLKAFDCHPAGSHDKRVPESVLTADDETVAEFLRVLYDCEGSVSPPDDERGRYVRFSSASRELVVGVGILLLRFGIVGNIRERTHDGEEYYELEIGRSDQHRMFRRHIGFDHPEKSTRLDGLCEIDSKANVHTLPLMPLLEDARDDLGMTQAEFYGDSKHVARMRRRNRITIDRLESMARRLPDEGVVDIVHDLDDADVTWDEVVEIEEIEHEGYIYDLTVPEHHTFATADGLVVHNTTLANRIARDWTGDAVGPESHVPHETRRARRKENVEIKRNGKSVTIDVVDTPGVTTKVDYKEFLEHDIEKDDAVRRSREATEGVAEAMHWLREDVDGVIYVLDAAEDPFTQVNTMLIGIIESQNLPVLIFANKIDLEDANIQRVANAFPQHETIPLSALEGDNMDEVYDKIAEYFG
ncbi:50S ribosome-binding GTPase [Natronomonas sp. F2-12]|jgi:small GTP-binding protein|uniref:50S ribosome-binding GTPase n=1 Tax=Natronomonas aquatica TaxID=2841590 RepID=A0A9R1CVX8_9EURY|nr:50S ribosome-binding GTPase [Natronomonas aquatica]